MNGRMAAIAVVAATVMALFTVAVLASNAEMYFSTDKNGAVRLTNVNEGQEVWICVYDPDENIDCDVRDKVWTDVKLFDPKTGALIIWESYSCCTSCGPDKYKGKAGCTSLGNYLEETGADTGLFVSNKPFQIGTREDYSKEHENTHVVDDNNHHDFKWGNYIYAGDYYPTKDTNVDGDTRGWIGLDEGGSSGYIMFTTGFMGLLDSKYAFPSEIIPGTGSSADLWLIGRFENMDTLVGMYQDPNDDTDVAVSMMKITDTEATISWNKSIYKDGLSAATVTVVDPDENLNCNKVEYVPVFIIVNPGSWNPVDSSSTETDQTGVSPNNFCMLIRTGGVDGSNASTSVPAASVGAWIPTRWYNLYNSERNDYGTAGAQNGRYYIQYPKDGLFPIGTYKSTFDTASANGVTAISFYAKETGTSTGVFELNLNSILGDLGFDSLRPRDVLVAYYLDPNDFDDFKLATSYIEEQQHSVTSFTDANRNEMATYWIGHDPVYVQVIDSNANVDSCCPEQVVVHICDPHEEDDGEYPILDEISSNSSIFFTNAGMELLPVWDALGVGLTTGTGGYQLLLDNWKLEVFNEDSIYARYNDQSYTQNNAGMPALGDADTTTAFSGPRIDRVRVGNDVSFALMEIGDTQVYNGTNANMYFLDRQGNRVSGYVNSDCVFVEVVDPDQNEDVARRERIDAYWDGKQNFPFGPEALNTLADDSIYAHSVNPLLGDTNIFKDEGDNAKLYVLNPRNGRWASVDLLETGVNTGDFVSVTCIDLSSQYLEYEVPTLGVKPGDTIIAVYQDPSNHSDSSWISVKVGIGGGGTPPSQASTTMFTDATGNEVTSYTDADDAYVKVIDPSHSGATSLLDAVEVDGTTYDLTPLAGAQSDTFITGPISGLGVGTFTANYADPTDPTDTSSDTISIIASELSVDNFYAGPNPFDTEVNFGFDGTGIATTFAVTVYDLSGHMVWTEEMANVDHVTWDGTSNGVALANGGYIYVVTASDDTNTFTGKGTLFISKSQ